MLRKVIQFSATVVALLLVTQMSFAKDLKPISSYKELYGVLANGHDVKAIIDLNQCTFKSAKGKKVDSSFLMGLNFTRFVKWNDGTQNNIIAADSFTVDSPAAGVVIDYMQLKMNSNNQIEVSGEYIDRLTSDVIGQSIFNCDLGTAVKLFDLS